MDVYDLDLYGADDALDLLGDESSGEDYVGASVLGRGPSAAAALLRARGGAGAARVLAQARQGLQAMAHTRKSAKLRRLAMAGLVPQIPMGVRNNSVAAGATTNISPEPGVPLRVTNFYASPPIAAFFLITQITVARVNMLAGSDAVPATLFTPEARHPPFENPILAAGSQIVVGVENIDGGAHPFFGAFIGIDLTPPYARVV